MAQTSGTGTVASMEGRRRLAVTVVAALAAFSFFLSLFSALSAADWAGEGVGRATAAAGSVSGREEKVDYAIALPEGVAAAYGECETSDERLPLGRDCLREKFAALLREHGVLPILNGLGMYREQHNLTCHQSAHVMGQAAYQVIGGLQEAYNIPKAGLCEFGYYHGTLQGWALDIGPEVVVLEFNKVCDDLAYKGGVEGDCIHALGHAVGIFLDPDLTERACSTLNGEQVVYCWYGYEMEYVERYSEEFKSLRETDPEAAEKRAYEEMQSCTNHDNEMIRMSCYRFHTTVAYTLLGEDKAMDLLKFCSTLGEGEKECFQGAVGENLAMHTILDEPGKPTPDYYCEAGRTRDIKAACYRMIAYTRLLLRNTYEAASAVCAYAGELEKECLARVQPDWERYLEDQKGYFGTGSAGETSQ